MPKPHHNLKSNQPRHHKLLHAYLEEFGLCIHSVKSDGNCFFRAIADQMEQNEHVHAKYRQKVMDYIEENKDFFAPFLEEDDADFDHYIRRMRRDGEWAGDLELHAVSDVLKRVVMVYQENAPNFVTGRDKYHDMIRISYHDGNHYNSVRQVSGARHEQVSKTMNRTEEIIMHSTGCRDLERIRHYLRQNEGDVDATIEFLVMEQHLPPQEEEFVVKSIQSEEHSMAMDEIRHSTGCSDATIISSALQRNHGDVEKAIDEVLQEMTPHGKLHLLSRKAKRKLKKFRQEIKKLERRKSKMGGDSDDEDDKTSTPTDMKPTVEI